VLRDLFDSSHKSATITCASLDEIEGENVDTQRIVSELKAERNRLDKAIAVLDGANRTPTTVAKGATSRKGAQAPRKRHGLTAAGRKRLSMLMKKRWAEKRKKRLSDRKQNAKTS
jgi:hypothetical protein